MQQSDEQTDPGMEARRREMDELINALPSAERGMLLAYFVSTQPSYPHSNKYTDTDIGFFLSLRNQISQTERGLDRKRSSDDDLTSEFVLGIPAPPPEKTINSPTTHA